MGGRGREVEDGGGWRNAGPQGAGGRTLHQHAPRDCCCPQAEGNLNIVMEFASRGNVEEAIKQRQATRIPFAELTVLSWLRQLGSALQHMHLKQTLHRDLKVLASEAVQSRVFKAAILCVREAAALGMRGWLPMPYTLHRDLKAANVFLTENGSADGSVKLGDFGISKTLSTFTNLAQTACGTPFYFSPELINSQPYHEPSDVWALGVLLFELLTLQRPYNGRNIATLALAITNGTYDEEALKLSPYPQWVRRLASREKLLHPDPHKRLPLPELLGAVGRLDVDESEAALLALKAQGPSPILLALKAQGPSPLPPIMPVQPSFRGAHSLPSFIHEEDPGPGRDGLHSPSKEKSGVITDEEHAINSSQLTRPIVLGAPRKAEEPSTSKDHAARGEDLDDLDTVYVVQSPPLVKDRELDEFDASTGSV